MPEGTEPALSVNGSQTDNHIAEGSVAPSAWGIPEVRGLHRSKSSLLTGQAPLSYRASLLHSSLVFVRFCQNTITFWMPCSTSICRIRMVWMPARA